MPSPSLPAWEALPDIGLYMDQLLSYTQRYFPGDLTPGMINSYVKSGLLDRPEKKKYSRSALARLLMVVSLKQVLPLDSLRLLLNPASGESAEALYARFLSARQRLDATAARHTSLTALDCALQAAAFQSLAREKLTPDAPAPARE